MITEAQLRTLVERFYAKIRQDEVLGPVFDAAIEDWPEHLDKLADFWSSVMLTTGRYKGNPMAAHMRQAGRITPAMFDRWLGLWGETAKELLSAEQAARVRFKAERIAESLKLALFFRLEPVGSRAAA